MKKYKREILWSAFALYCVFLLWILFFSREAERIPLKDYLSEYTSLLPFRTTAKYIRYVWLRRDLQSLALALLNIGGNLILFFPMGFFLPMLFPRMKRPAHLFCHITAAIVSAELAQALLRLGVFDIDDILYNFIGAYWGYIASRHLCRFFVA